MFKLMRLFKCTTCDGEGGWKDYVEAWELSYQPCPRCQETGKIAFMEWFWEHAPIRFVEWVGDAFYNRG